MSGTRLIRRPAIAAAAAGLALTVAACGSSSKSPDSGTGGGAKGSASNGTPLDPSHKVTISVDCEPAKNDKINRKTWTDDVAAFQKLHPNITIKSIDTFPCEDPAAFTARLKGGKQADVFYAYATDTAQVLDSGQAADITSYVNSKTVPTLDSFDPAVLNVGKDGGKLYSLPNGHYAMGLVINTKLFKQAGLDPAKIPSTWEEVAADAKQISDKVGHGVAGYADYSAGNNGGWHFTAELYAQGGSMVNADGTKAAFNTGAGKQVLQNLHDMRYRDNSMGARQDLAWADLLKMAAADKVGMYIGAPDTIQAIVNNFKGSWSDFAVGPMPGQGGPAKGTLGGGDQYFFKKSLSPDQIKAGIMWLNYEKLTPGKGQFDYARAKTLQLPVGLPEPQLYTGTTGTAIDKLRADNATIPVDNFKAFRDNPVAPKLEPPNAQAIYKVLDTAMSAVLTNKNADIGKLLSTAEGQVNTVLAANAG